ncbi:hypothetical protein [Paenibacillus cymbidii]|uniref:hypothetical protein n=1 Tax=Paenibacillus cymbidii TaxID=1639034 RepID=UPI001080D285|nr:hypothetical protein [Paenibacillus cymbidii]
MKSGWRYVSKRKTVAFSILMIALFLGAGLSIASSATSNKSTPTDLINQVQDRGNGAPGVTMEDLKSGKAKTAPLLKTELSDDMLKMIHDKVTNVVPEVRLTDEEKLNLYKQGYSFDEIDLAASYVNEQRESNVEEVLKKRQEELRNYKERIDRIKVVKERKDVVSYETQQEWLAKGYSRAEIGQAWENARLNGKSMKEELEQRRAVPEKLDEGKVRQ